MTRNSVARCLPQQERIASLTVTGGVPAPTRIHGTCFTSIEAGQFVTVTAVTQPNDDATWTNIDWVGMPAVAQVDPGNRIVRIPRDNALGPLVIKARLGNTKSVKLCLLEIQDLVCENGVAIANINGRPAWKLYYGGPEARLVATPSINWYRYRNRFVWEWNIHNPPVPTRRHRVPIPAAAAAPPVPNQQIIATLYSHTQDIYLKRCQVPELQVDQLTFSGGHTIHCDTMGYFDNIWNQARNDPNPALAPVDPATNPNSPLCYRRDRPVSITAHMQVTTAPTMAEQVTIRGRANFNGIELRWEEANLTVNPGDATVTTGVMHSHRNIPNRASYYHDIPITWEVIGPDNVTRAAGQSRHDIYTLLDDPVCLTTYWTLVHLSCSQANNTNSVSRLISRTFDAFRLPAGGVFRRRDNHQLAYWVPQHTNAGDTQQLLGRPDGGGQCGSWADLFVDMLRVHGIARVVKRQIEHPQPTWGFLVKNWTFNHPPASNLGAFTHGLYGNCVTRPPNGIAGQNNPDPPPGFNNHFVALDTRNRKVYDPSYGVSFRGFTLWEAAAIDGLFENLPQPTAGYDKSQPGGAGRRLLIDN